MARLTKPPSDVSRPLKVRATRMGYYDHIRRRERDVFVLSDEAHFSRRWMERVDPGTPERVTTGAEELRAKHNETIRDRVSGGVQAAADEDDNPLRAHL